MPNPFFSIITPVYNRANDGRLKRCLDSTSIQTLGDFEHIIVDDGSKDDVESVISQFDERYKYVRIEHQGRVQARNAGYAVMKGQWVTNLDSDDTYDPEYLHTFHYHITQNPGVHLWVCASCLHGVLKDENGKHLVPKWTKIRKAWKPPMDKTGEAVHAFFTSGKIGLGQYVFSREAFEKIGPFPSDWYNHYHIADGVHEWTGYQMDTPFYSAAKRWVGDPNGEDHCQMLALARYYEVSLIDAALYRQYKR